MTPAPGWVVKRVLLGPAAVRRAAARRATDPVERWMLTQSLEVRASYVRNVLERGGSEELEQAWMLHQPDEVRHSFTEHVLGVDRQQFS
jgi:hypothetical protein